MIEVVIPQYIRKVELSKSRMKKYYELTKALPKAKKYHDKSKYEYKEWPGFGKRRFLVDLSTGERVIANPKAAGTPKVSTINGQKIYNGEVGKHMRNKILSAIKDSFAPYIAKLDPITDFPVRINLEIHDVIRDEGSFSLWDLDNRAMPYIKAFQDCLTGNRGGSGTLRSKKVLEDDNIIYITQSPVPLFIPVSKSEDRKLVFTIVKETDNRILRHKDFMAELERLNMTI